MRPDHLNPLKIQSRKSSESKDKDKKFSDSKNSDKKHDGKGEKKDAKKEPSKEEKGERRDDRYHSSERRNGKEEGRKLEHGPEERPFEKVCTFVEKKTVYLTFLIIHRDLVVPTEAEHVLENQIRGVNMIVVCLQRVNTNVESWKF